MIENSFTIREASKKDFAFITKLSIQLGYSTSEDETKERLNIILNNSNNYVIVAENKNKEIVGWIHIFGCLRVESEPFAEVGGLVVNENLREKGIGTLLLKKAEEWAIENNYKSMRIRSNIKRDATRIFYEKKGYKIIKVQNVFYKDLA